MFSRKGTVMESKDERREFENPHAEVHEDEQPQNQKTNLVAALEGRAQFFSLIASLFYRPLTQEQIDNIAAMDLSAYAGLNETFDSGINDMSRYLRKRNTGTREQLATDFTSTFIGTKTYEGKSAVPYESVFTNEDGLMCQESFHQVRATYRKAAFRKREGDSIPDDHMGYMCEFISVLSKRAASEIEAGNTEAAARDLTLTRDFLNQHILSWYDQLAERASHIVSTRFYRGVLSLAEGYFAFDASIADDLIAAAAGLTPRKTRRGRRSER